MVARDWITVALVQPRDAESLRRAATRSPSAAWSRIRYGRGRRGVRRLPARPRPGRPAGDDHDPPGRRHGPPERAHRERPRRRRRHPRSGRAVQSANARSVALAGVSRRARYRRALLRRRRALILAAISAGALSVGGSATAPAQTSLSAQRDAAARLRAQVAAESRRIAATSAGLADAQARLGALDARVNARMTRLRDAQNELVRTRIRLTKLQNRAEQANTRCRPTWSTTTRRASRTSSPSCWTRTASRTCSTACSYFRRVANRNARILDIVRTARARRRPRGDRASSKLRVRSPTSPRWRSSSAPRPT